MERNDVATSRASGLPSVMAFVCVLLGACAEEPPSTGDVTPTSAEWTPLGTLDEVLAAESAPFDPRLATMFPEALAGQERFCDLVFVGTVHALRRDERHLYPQPEGAPPISHRATARCRASTGESWADLAFAKESSPLAAYVRAGTRIRVRVRGVQGFEGYPVLDFLAQRGEAPTAISARSTYAPVLAGARFDRAVASATLPCGVAHVGTVRPVTRDGVTHAALVTCRHPTGESTVEVGFSEPHALLALNVRRGEVVPLRVIDPSGGPGGHPVVLFAGP